MSEYVIDVYAGEDMEVVKIPYRSPMGTTFWLLPDTHMDGFNVGDNIKWKNAKEAMINYSTGQPLYIEAFFDGKDTIGQYHRWAKLSNNGCVKLSMVSVWKSTE